MMICSCSLCTAQVEAGERRRADREAYQRSLDWQFAVVSEARAAGGERHLTYSEWLAGDFDEEENGDVAMKSNRLALFVALLFAVAVLLALTACQTPATRIQTVEVKIPVAVQPITWEQVPTVPAPLGPRPQSLSAAADVLLAKHCEWVAYALKADPLLRLAAKLKMQALPTFPECEGR